MDNHVLTDINRPVASLKNVTEEGEILGNVYIDTNLNSDYVALNRRTQSFPKGQSLILKEDNMDDFRPYRSFVIANDNNK